MIMFEGYLLLISPFFLRKIMLDQVKYRVSKVGSSELWRVSAMGHEQNGRKHLTPMLPQPPCFMRSCVKKLTLLLRKDLPFLASCYFKGLTPVTGALMSGDLLNIQ